MCKSSIVDQVLYSTNVEPCETKICTWTFQIIVSVERILFGMLTLQIHIYKC